MGEFRYSPGNVPYSIALGAFLMSGGKISGYPTYPPSFPPIHRVTHISTKFPTYPPSCACIHHVSHLSTELSMYPPRFSPIHRVAHVSITFPTYPPDFPPSHHVSHLSTEFLIYPPIFLSIHQVSHLSTEFLLIWQLKSIEPRRINVNALNLRKSSTALRDPLRSPTRSTPQPYEIPIFL